MILPDRLTFGELNSEIDERKKEETMTEYGLALTRLVSNAYPDMLRTSRKALAIEQFVTGLPSLELRRHVQFHHPQTLHEAAALATEYESFKTRQYEGRRKPKDQQIQRVAYEKAKKDKHLKVLKQIATAQKEFIQQMTSSQKNLTQQLIATQKGLAEGQRTIVDCLTSNHKKLMKVIKPGPPKNNSMPTKTTCFNCKEDGHWSNQCPYPPQAPPTEKPSPTSAFDAVAVTQLFKSKSATETAFKKLERAGPCNSRPTPGPARDIHPTPSPALKNQSTPSTTHVSRPTPSPARKTQNVPPYLKPQVKSMLSPSILFLLCCQIHTTQTDPATPILPQALKGEEIKLVDVTPEKVRPNSPLSTTNLNPGSSTSSPSNAKGDV